MIVVRVNDTGGGGGIYGHPHSIGNVRLSDIVILKTYDKPLAFTTQNSPFKRTLICHLRVPVEKLKGNLSIRIYDPKTGKAVSKKNEKIVLGEQADSSITSGISIKDPDTYKIEYTLTTDSFADTLRYNTLFSYKQGSHMNEKYEYPVVKNTIPGKAEPFGLEDISFGGYLNDRLNANLTQRLLYIDETGILECFYNRPGKQTYMDRIADILISCQNEDGYLGTCLPANCRTE